ncbi:MAG: hypothetical protein JO015_11755 [Verrucomicrobia bacterium]|nr:hypothetical protein [Verrucomicrobiota bacterium]
MLERFTRTGLSRKALLMLFKNSTRLLDRESLARPPQGAGIDKTARGIVRSMSGLGKVFAPCRQPLRLTTVGTMAGTLIGLGVCVYRTKRKKATVAGVDGIKLNYWNRSWPLLPFVCPCDVDFVSYLRTRQISKRAIFHFGSGAHHLLGRANLEAEGPNEVLAVTASPEEHSRYVDFIVANPAAARHYKVLFTDIYTLSEALLPMFDLVTLFHLHEFYDEKKQRYAHLNDRSLLGMFLRKLSEGGLVFFYKGSNGFNLTTRTLKEYIATQRLIFHEEYKSLVIYRRGPSGGTEGEER